ncbi:MAG: TonB-dependent receptor [Bacteroidales bacterium]|nr:TonB-dependent receptor [Bacteroidales bacterium]
MNKFFYILFFLALAFASSSQELQIQGKLIDSTTKASLQFSNIIIKNQNDSVIKGVLTNEKGEFKINLVIGNGYKLVANSMGYKEKTILLNIDIKTKTYRIGEITLAPKVFQLKETNVASNVPYMEKKFDRKVFNISEAKTAAARSIFDLLRTLPGVVVNEEGSVRYKGAEATIYVDDQPSNFMYPKLEMIPVAKVDKIELIDASMQSGGEGKGGIINIKMKSVNTDGLSGIASSDINTIEFKNIDKSENFVNANYKKNKVTILNNFSIDENLYNSSSQSESKISAFQTPTEQSSNYSSNSDNKSYYDYFGAIYNPTKKTRFYFGGGTYNSSFISGSSGDFTELESSIKSILNSNNNCHRYDSKYDYKGINFSFRHKFDTNDTYIRMFAGFQFIDDFSNSSATYNYEIINSVCYDSIFKYDRKDLSYGNRGLYSNIFYNHTISKNARWNIRYYNYFKLKENNDSKYYIFDDLYMPETYSNNSTSQYHNMSARIGSNWNKWKFDGGVNAQYTKTEIAFLRHTEELKDTAFSVVKDYLKILPSVTISFAINDTEEIKLTLSQTTQTPYYLQLSDYISKENPYYWWSGNSKLKPSDFYSAYLGYSYTKEKWNASAEGFFNYTNNEITYVSYPLTSMLYLSKPMNGAKKSETGIDVSTWVMVTDKLNFSLSSSISYVYYNSKALQESASKYNLPTENLINRQFGYNIKYNMEYKIKKFYAMFYVNYFSRELKYNGYNYGYINSSFNVSRKFFKDKLRITLSANNLFDDMVKRGSVENYFGIYQVERRHSSNYKRMYGISIQYTFRQGDRGTKDMKVGG